MQKIIAVLNDFNMADVVLERALEFSSKQKTTLEVLYVHEEPLFDVPDYFRSDASIKSDVLDTKKIKKEIQSRIAKLDNSQEYAVLVFIDDTVDRVLTQTEDTKDLLIITAYHDKITEKLAKKTQLPILVIKNDFKAYKDVILPVDLGQATSSCIDFAETLFERDTLFLLHDYRYIVDLSMMDVDYLGVPTSAPVVDAQINQELIKSQKESFEILKKERELEGSFIEQSLSVEDDLVEFIEGTECDLTVLCSDNQHSILSDSVSFSLLKNLSTDILIYIGMD